MKNISNLTFCLNTEAFNLCFEIIAESATNSKRTFKLFEMKTENMLQDTTFDIFPNCDQVSPNVAFAVSGHFSSIIAGEFRQMIGRIQAINHKTVFVVYGIEEHLGSKIFKKDALVLEF